AGVFNDGQGVHVGADHDGGARAVLEDGDDAVAADLGGDLEAERLEFLGHAGGGQLLLEGQLGVGVEVLVELVEAGRLLLDQVVDLVEPGGVGLVGGARRLVGLGGGGQEQGDQRPESFKCGKHGGGSG